MFDFQLSTSCVISNYHLLKFIDHAVTLTGCCNYHLFVQSCKQISTLLMEEGHIACPIILLSCLVYFQYSSSVPFVCIYTCNVNCIGSYLCLLSYAICQLVHVVIYLFIAVVCNVCQMAWLCGKENIMCTVRTNRTFVVEGQFRQEKCHSAVQ